MAEINEVVVVGMARTAIGRYLGGLASVRANDLAITAANAAIERAGVDPGIIDEIVGATCLHAGNGSLPPRIIGMKVGLPVRSGSCMVSQNCASGMRAT
ncbi:MAG: acetyl-CoA C-acetyltransferase, partial [Syntrophomonas sp.]|nr:acetyl-CoA C-acetyltransferase [Syntrophomonas sp.]